MLLFDFDKLFKGFFYFNIMPHLNFRFHHHKKRRKVPSERFVKNLDKVCLLFSVLMPATTIPQIIKIYSTQDVSGLSLSMWILYTIGVIPFLIYGIVHKEKPLILLNILWIIAQLIIIFGILIYM